MVEGRVEAERAVAPGEGTAVVAKVVGLVAARAVEGTAEAPGEETAVVARAVARAEGVAEMVRVVVRAAVVRVPFRVGKAVVQEEETVVAARVVPREAAVARTHAPVPTTSERSMCGCVGCRQTATPLDPPKLRIRYPCQARPQLTWPPMLPMHGSHGSVLVKCTSMETVTVVASHRLEEEQALAHTNGLCHLETG